jgi:Flp pilus assembly protein CpaB
VNPFRRRPPTSSLVLFGVAACLAAGAVAAVGSYVRRVETTRPDLGPAVPILVASSDLVRGSVISDASAVVTSLPRDLAPPGSFSSSDQILGRTLVADIARGEPFTSTRVSGSGQGPVAALVPDGLRAFVLRSGMPAGSLAPGDVVDVIATYGAGGGRPYTDTVATEIEVARVLGEAPGGLAGSSGADAGVAIVLLTDPLTVEALARASALGVITTSIVGGSGTATALATGVASPSASAGLGAD